MNNFLFLSIDFIFFVNFYPIYNKMVDYNFKDTLMVSAIFFIVGSEFFDNWIKDFFPQLRSGNPIFVTIIKSVIFAGLYYIYYLFKKKGTPESEQKTQ